MHTQMSSQPAAAVVDEKHHHVKTVEGEAGAKLVASAHFTIKTNQLAWFLTSGDRYITTCHILTDGARCTVKALLLPFPKPHRAVYRVLVIGAGVGKTRGINSWVAAAKANGCKVFGDGEVEVPNISNYRDGGRWDDLMLYTGTDLMYVASNNEANDVSWLVFDEVWRVTANRTWDRIAGGGRMHSAPVNAATRDRDIGLTVATAK